MKSTRAASQSPVTPAVAKTRGRRIRSRSRALHCTGRGMLMAALALSSCPLATAQKINPQSDALKARAQRLFHSLPTASRAVRETLVLDLLSERDTTLSVLHGVLVSGSSQDKMRALRLVELIRDGESVGPLSRCLADTSERVRARCAALLSKFASPAGRSAVLQRLDDEPSVHVKALLLTTAGAIGKTEDADRLRPYLASTDPEVRLGAAMGLAKLGSPEGDQLIIEATRSGVPLVELRATRALADVTSRQGIERAEELVRSGSSPWVSHARLAILEHQLDLTPERDVPKLLGAAAQSNDAVISDWAVMRLAELPPEMGRSQLQRLSQARGSELPLAHQLLAAQEGGR